MKKAKQISKLLVFSKRMYAICKCALESEKFTKILVRLYNKVIRIGFYPTRQTKIIDVMIEKRKGPRINKLHTIQLIEANI